MKEYEFHLRTAVTNALSASLHGLPVGPLPLSTAPGPLRCKRARHERQPFN